MLNYVQLCESVEDKRLRDVLKTLIGDIECYRVPAAIYHHTEEWGLMNHCVEVANFAVQIATMTQMEVCYDYLVFGGLLHDYGKTLVPRELGLWNGPVPHAVNGATAVYKALEAEGSFDVKEIRDITNMIANHHKNDSGMVCRTMEDMIIRDADYLSVKTWTINKCCKSNSNTYDVYDCKNMHLSYRIRKMRGEC